MVKRSLIKWLVVFWYVFRLFLSVNNWLLWSLRLFSYSFKLRFYLPFKKTTKRKMRFSTVMRSSYLLKIWRYHWYLKISLIFEDIIWCFPKKSSKAWSLRGATSPFLLLTVAKKLHPESFVKQDAGFWPRIWHCCILNFFQWFLTRAKQFQDLICAIPFPWRPRSHADCKHFKL